MLYGILKVDNVAFLQKPVRLTETIVYFYWIIGIISVTFQII